MQSFVYDCTKYKDLRGFFFLVCMLLLKLTIFKNVTLPENMEAFAQQLIIHFISLTFISCSFLISQHSQFIQVKLGCIIQVCVFLKSVMF